MAKKMNMEDQFADWTDKWEKAQKEGIFDEAPKPAQPRTQHTPDFFGQYPSLDAKKGLNAVDAEYWKQVYQMSSHSGDAPDVTDNSAFEDGDDHYLHDHRKAKGKVYKEFFGGKDLRPKQVHNGKDIAKRHPVSTEPHGHPKRPSSIEDYVTPSTDVGGEGADYETKARMMGTDPNPQYSNGYGPDMIDHNTGHVRVSPGLAAADKSILKIDELKRALYDLECKMSDANGYSESKIKSLDSKLHNLKRQIEDLSSEIAPHFPSDHL